METLSNHPKDMDSASEHFAVSEEVGYVEGDSPATLPSAASLEVTDLTQIGRPIPRPVSRRYDEEFIADL